MGTETALKMGEMPNRLRDKTTVDVFKGYKMYVDELLKFLNLIEAEFKIKNASVLRNVVDMLGKTVNNSNSNSNNNSNNKLIKSPQSRNSAIDFEMAQLGIKKIKSFQNKN